MESPVKRVMGCDREAMRPISLALFPDTLVLLLLKPPK
jgi:hypothetical protein